MASRQKLKQLVVPARLGPLERLEPLGRGTTGGVFRAHHTRLGRSVAVKVIDPRLGQRDPVLLKRFVREVRLLASIRDPHVVQVLEAGQDGPYAYAVMELVTGRSLLDLQEAAPGRRLAPGLAAQLLEQVARGLEAVHRCGVVHRDLKPENVLVDARGLAKLADFGLARGPGNEQLTHADEVVGTPEYMAPEAIRQREYDGRADLYALGITAYELLSGDTPFHQGGVLEVVRDHLERAPEPLAERVPGLPAGLADLVHRLLAKDPGDRPQTAAEVATALGRFAAPPQTQGPGGPPGTPYWEEVLLLRALLAQGLGPLEAWTEALRIWQGPAAGPGLARALAEQGGVPLAALESGARQARIEATSLRNRLAREQLARLGKVPRERLEALTLAPGRLLTPALVASGLLSPEDAAGIERGVTRALVGEASRALSRSCQGLGLTPAPLARLSVEVPPAVYRGLLLAFVRGLLERL